MQETRAKVRFSANISMTTVSDQFLKADCRGPKILVFFLPSVQQVAPARRHT